MEVITGRFSRLVGFSTAGRVPFTGTAALCYYGQVIRSLRPPPNPDSAPFWEACAEREFMLPQCGACGLMFWYPRMACPHCGSPDVDFAPSPGTGTVWSHTEVHISFFGPQWSDDVPYTVLLVDLDDGPRLLSRLSPQSAPVATGDRVHVTFVDTDNGPLPCFARG